MFATALARRWKEPFEIPNRRLEELFDEPEPLLSMNGVATYALDIHQDDRHYYVEAELPGFAQNDIDASLLNGTLTIRAEKNDKSETRGEVLHKERHWTKYYRSFQLPEKVDENKVAATLQDGVLKIALNRGAEAAARKIAIANGGGCAPATE